MKILIADDDRISRTAISLVLRKAGHEVVTAEDGLAAWHCLQQPDAPQIAVLDWMMPGLNGPEICQLVRARTPRLVVHLLLLTSKSAPQDVIVGLKAGADDFLHKPFNPSELKARLEVGQRVVQLYNELGQKLTEQQLNLDQARRLLTIANAGVPRWIAIDDELTLHLTQYSASSQRAGGDHCWARTLSGRDKRGPVTLIGLRDQSGHEVNCILRSIATDLFHKEAMDHGLSLEAQMVYVNDRLCASGMFAEDDFVTGLTLELDHTNLQLRYVSCGHPSLFLVRQTEVIALPGENGQGRNLPLGSLANLTFETGHYQLAPGDRLILFTDGLFEIGKFTRGAMLTNELVRQFIASSLTQAPDLPVRKLVRNLLHAARGPLADCQQAAPPDDVTVLGIELEPDAGPHVLEFHPASLGELDQIICQTHERLLSDWQSAPPSTERLRLFLDEALTNAWCHGNQQNPRLPITLSWGQHNGCSVVVEDAGKGFDPTRLPDPCSPTELLNEQGRGVYLIRNSCEWAGWKKDGTRLIGRWNCG